MANEESIEAICACIILMRKHGNDLALLTAKMVEEDSKMLDKLTDMMQAICGHKYDNGKTAIVKNIFFDSCNICGEEW